MIGVASLCLPVAADVPPMPKLDSDHVQRTDTRLIHMHKIHEFPPSMYVQKELTGMTPLGRGYRPQIFVFFGEKYFCGWGTPAPIPKISIPAVADIDIAYSL